MVTNTDKAMVVGKRDSKTSQSMPAKSGLSSEHFRKFLCGHHGGVGWGHGEQQSEEGPVYGRGKPHHTCGPHLRTQYTTNELKEGCYPRMGADGLHCAREKDCSEAGVPWDRGGAAGIRLGRIGRGPGIRERVQDFSSKCTGRVGIGGLEVQEWK